MFMMSHPFVHDTGMPSIWFNKWKCAEIRYGEMKSAEADVGPDEANGGKKVRIYN